MELKFEEKYQGQLLSLESTIVAVYRKNQQLTDYSVMEVLDGLIRFYQAEALGRNAPARRLEPLDQQLFEQVGAICEMLLGKGELRDEKGKVVSLADLNPALKTELAGRLNSTTQEELLACLKRLRKSVTRWNKANGRRGYLDFVSKYFLR
ncbi:MAG: hypothetical protein HY231_08395 [Acidobacteria bacterium]|nr:hypothetical protein [Acidobacteriota bacterium]